MAQVTVRPGRVALIDDEDWERVKRYCWRIAKDQHSGAEYVVAGAGRGKQVFLQRVVMNATQGTQVRFKSRDHLDCRKANLSLGSVPATWREKFRRLQTELKNRLPAEYHATLAEAVEALT